jgi:hypothetical protein
MNTTMLIHLWRRHGWLIIGLLWIVALALGYAGFAAYYSAAGQHAAPLDLAYLTLQLISMNSGAVEPPAPWPLQVSRFLLPFLAAFTVVRALVTVFQDRWQQFLVRTLWREHTVICGLSRKGWLLARGFSAQGARVMVIESDENNDLIAACRERGVTVLLGDAAAPDLLRRAAVARAQHLIAVTDDDGVNAEVAVRIQALLRGVANQRRAAPLTCTVHLVDPQLCDLARAREMALERDLPLRLELFNVFDRGARLLWNRYAAGILAGQGSTPPTAGCAGHVLVIGLGRLGESLVVHAGREWYGRLRAEPPTVAGRLRVTIIDRDADWKCQALAQRYPKLAQACDLAPSSIDVRWPAFLEGAFLAAGDDYPAPAVIFVCFDDDSLGLRTGLDVHHRLRQRPGNRTPVVVRMAEAGGLARLLGPNEHNKAGFVGLHAFGLLESTCTPQVIQGGTHTLLARGLHEGYMRRQQDLGETAASNPALRPWEELSDDLRESNLAEADAIGQHLAVLGYDLAPLTDWDAAFFVLPEPEVERLAELEHERFVADRLNAGWRYAPGPKDPAARTSPALLPWDDVAEAERIKTRASISQLPATLAQAGFQIVRRHD